MSGNAKLFERYKKSDIFNVKDDDDTPTTDRAPRVRNPQESLKDTQNDIFHTLDTESINVKKPYMRKYVLRHHKSDIFNINDIVQAPKRPTLKKSRNASNYSTCFEFMKNNDQFRTDIKEYYDKNRAEKKVYNPDKYFDHEDPAERVYNNLYDKKRNPILPNRGSNIMKSSTNLLSNINLNDKQLFKERKKKMTRQFTTAFLNNENLTERKKLTEENVNGIKNHKFYKSKGFTYQENNYMTENKYIQPDQYPGNSSKINKQIHLQSNIFNENDENKKKANDINKIKERIKTAVENDEDRPKKIIKTIINNNRNKRMEGPDNDRNIWGALHNNWEKSNLDWRDPHTEIIFSKTFMGRFPKINLEKRKEKEKEDAFQRKVKQLSDSGFKDTINESIKSKRKWEKVPLEERLNHSNLEQIDEVLNEIPDAVLKPDRKKKIIDNANTTEFNGNIGIDDKYINYKKYHKKILNKPPKKEPIVKIMSKQGNKAPKKTLNRTFTNVNIHDEYTIHNYVLSYDIKPKSSNTSFDNFSEDDMRLIFSKKGIHIYNIQKNHFDNGKYNTIKFKVRENEGEKELNQKIKELESDLSKKQYKICIEKEVEKDKKKSLRGVVKNPFSKGLIVAEDLNKNKEKKQPQRLKKNTSFSGMFSNINFKYKK